jgi:general secretion pathway protein C
MLARWSTFVVWALVAAGALLWGLKLFVAGPPLPPRTTVAATAPVARGDLSRLLGVEAPEPAVAVNEPAPDARYQLVGVVTPRAMNAAREGLALIAVDGKPAKAFRVGAVVDGDTVLKTVAARGATLGPRHGAALVALNIAPPAAAATGALPPAGAVGATVNAALPVPAVAQPLSQAPQAAPQMQPRGNSRRLQQPAPMPAAPPGVPQPQDDALSK